jgi:CRP/FNR family cyclic AMP-dependent transcriptional regulator
MAVKLRHEVTASAFLQDVGPGKRIRTYQDKEVVYSQESPANALFYIQSGMVMLTVVSKGGHKKAVLALLHEGDLFGEGCLAGQTRRISTAISVGESTLTRVEKAIFRRQLDRDRALADMFIAYLIGQTARFKADLADHFLHFSERRLARILVMHKDGVQGSKGGPHTFRFSQTALAEMVGTTRARVSVFMNEFRRKGYVRYNGGLEVNVERLTAFLQG